jgi:Flp pilus assembly protein TadG
MGRGGLDLVQRHQSQPVSQVRQVGQPVKKGQASEQALIGRLLPTDGKPMGHERSVRGERGASLVEFALVLPVLISLVFGILDFGIIYSNQISFRNGVREGARMGVVDNLDTACQSGDLGTFNGTAPSTRMQNLMCATKNQIGLTPKSNVKIKVVFDTSYAQYKGLIVCAITPVTSKTGLFSTLLNGKFLKSKVEMTIEKTNITTQTAGEESLATTGSWAGSSWSWCNATTPSP